MDKDEIIVRLREMLDETENNIKKFEETKDFDYISELTNKQFEANCYKVNTKITNLI